MPAVREHVVKPAVAELTSFLFHFTIHFLRYKWWSLRAVERSRTAIDLHQRQHHDVRLEYTCNTLGGNCFYMVTKHTRPRIKISRPVVRSTLCPPCETPRHAYDTER